MADQPPFLRRCNKFPVQPTFTSPPDSLDPLQDYYCDSDCSYELRERRHEQQQKKCRRWGRSFEISVSLEALVEMKDAAELLFGFVMRKYKKNDDDNNDDEDEEDGKEDDDDFYHNGTKKIIWMSNDTFIVIRRRPRHLAWDSDFGDFYWEQIHVYSHENDYDGNVLCIVHQPSRTGQAATPSSPHFVGVMDALLRLLAKHKTVRRVQIKTKYFVQQQYEETGCFASVDALRAFVSEEEAPSDRSISFNGAGLSRRQWHTVVFHCHKNVKLDIFCGYGLAALTEAAICNHFPAKVKVTARALKLTSEYEFPALLHAFEFSSLLEELDVACDVAYSKEHFRLLIGAISRNRRLHKLRLGLKIRHGGYNEPEFHLTDAEWKLCCEAVTSHPTLQDVQVCSELDTIYVSCSPEMDRILIQRVCQNTVLCKFVMEDVLLHNERSFYEAINPVLQLNRVRQVVQTIKNETDPLRRQGLFKATLTSNPVRKCPSCCYLLLKENYDVLLEPSSSSASSTTMESNLLVRDWEMARRHLVSLEKTMRNRGIVIPTSHAIEKSPLPVAKKHKGSHLSG